MWELVIGTQRKRDGFGCMTAGESLAPRTPESPNNKSLADLLVLFIEDMCLPLSPEVVIV